MATSEPEPWLRGPIEGIQPLVMPVFFSFAQVRGDLAMHMADLSDEAVWKDVRGASAGFHLKHIAGSVDRLTTYLFGGQLSAEQLRFLAAESIPSGGKQELLSLVEKELGRSEDRLRTLDAAAIFESRTVGRRALPTTVIGLLVHLSEHTQRHLGQVITLAKMLA